MTEQEGDHWQIMHVLRGNHLKPGLCSAPCEDPICQYGCLRQSAKTNFRAAIMHGVEVLRKQSDPRFPLMIPDTNIKREDCRGFITCRDPVCQVVGCMDIPAYNFRELIKIANDNKIIKALKR